ncbi:hypothetical protein J5X84_17185 [Streptosporangiaceae bacterium NEAU-GS5]|nr:hypothetical protein [Streptosporangiaceae bacterium NEAU-GS5]
MRLPQRATSQAVLLGVGKYDDTALSAIPAVERNLRDLERVLTDPSNGGFAADRCVIQTPGFADRPAASVARIGRDVTDTFLVYYCGHATRVTDGELMLTLSDTSWEELEYSGLRISELRKAMMDSPAQVRVLILDCCFSGSAIPSILEGDSSDAIIEAAAIEGAFILTSSAANQPSNAPPGRPHTTFTGTMIDVLENGVVDGPELISLNDLYKALDWKLRAGHNPAPKRVHDGSASDIALVRNRAYDARTATRGDDGPPYMALYSQVADRENAPAGRIVALESIAGRAERDADFRTALSVIAANVSLPVLFRVNAIVQLARLGDLRAAVDALKPMTEHASERAVRAASEVLTLPHNTSAWFRQLKRENWTAPPRFIGRLQDPLSDEDLWGIHMARLLRAMRLDVNACIAAARELAGELDDADLATSLIRGLARDRSLTEPEQDALGDAMEKLAARGRLTS